ncbi:hypothetical protein BCR37DRAFT_389359 [Protomyces lactucae-debilis]|uniref:Uncharacterized protein n=1 Tax=Protomyces lactucae-debilis TaxID=2754530 RepID=A0A1Y2EYE2_PROLT|nr:uncharacterized protein BCR37DRAFT_389359 [Protomyces lactucae-debilis]ORY76651.1 hypothetical protein BCR37DRAFT_389359 [Protomyces lactucae-debilis]
MVLYASAAINLIFWGNLATWVFMDYAVKKPESTSTAIVQDGETLASEYERAPLRTRILYATGLGGLGLAISTGFLLVSKRVVRRIDLMPGGTHVKLFTGFRNPASTLPLQANLPKTATPVIAEGSTGGSHIALTDLMLRKALFTGAGPNQAYSESGSYTQLLRKGQLIGYLLDRRGSFLGGPRVLDELITTSRA